MTMLVYKSNFMIFFIWSIIFALFSLSLVVPWIYTNWYDLIELCIYRAQPDPLMQTEGHSIAGGFGEALSSALDVMAFTHDLDMASANGLNLQSNSIKAAVASAASAVVAPNAGNNIGKINQAINPNFVKPNELAVSTSGVGLFQQAKSAIDTGMVKYGTFKV